MNILFCSSVFDMSEYGAYCRKSKVPVSLTNHNLNSSIVFGIEKNLGHPITLINNLNLGSFPKYPKLIFRERSWSHSAGSDDVDAGFINLTCVKEYTKAASIYHSLEKNIIRLGDSEDINIIVYDLDLCACKSIMKIKKKYPRVKTCVFLPDIPSTMTSVIGNGKKTMYIKYLNDMKMKFINEFDSYIFTSGCMSDFVNISGKKYTVVEAMYDHTGAVSPVANGSTKSIVYTGLLNPKYGIDVLINAFLELQKEKRSNYELWICGHGSYAEKIVELSKYNKNIKFFGYVGKEKIRELHSKATVLVNPRQNIGDYTKYTFPSKTVEYLASGNPMIGYKLDGIPKEYDSYIQYVKDNSVEALKSKILEICELSDEDRHLIGGRARKFIFEEKNPEMMCKKIVEMLKRK